MFQIIKNYLRNTGINYHIIEENKAVDFFVFRPKGKWECMASCFPETGGFAVHSTLLESVPKEKRTKVALYLMGLNNLQLLGNFELDVKGGDIRFKTYVDCNAVELTEKVIDRTFLTNVLTMEQYLPEIKALLHSA